MGGTGDIVGGVFGVVDGHGSDCIRSTLRHGMGSGVDVDSHGRDCIRTMLRHRMGGVLLLLTVMVVTVSGPRCATRWVGVRLLTEDSMAARVA